MVNKEEEKNYKKPKISKIWNFLIYGSTIAIGIFLIWLYSAYIFINKWKKVKKGRNVKRRNALLGEVGNVSAIIELVDSWSKLEGIRTLFFMEYTEEQLKIFIKEKRPDLVKKPEPSLNDAVIAFLEKYEVKVEEIDPESIGFWKKDGGTLGGQKNQSKILEWTLNGNNGL